VEFSSLSDGADSDFYCMLMAEFWLRQRDTLRARFDMAAGLNRSGWLKTTIEKLSREMAGELKPL
jgi:hypothetical protein